ncbi:hypothetical protein RvY_13556 [Ramazzottius varieornatus]|uniref:Translin-associated protein X n=1 Tax=Ramazzottius varieornatus TaxID=947166 RepID=A0A1D1VVQ9_RAMVA|nr:hypothetical protein RvY_13556 [Ramazzottius varieornatus]
MDTKYQKTESRPYRARGRGGFRGSRASSDRGRHYGKEAAADPISRVPDTPTMAMFREIAVMLDEKNDLYEVLVKHSRDTTIESKRIIFLLIRCAGHPHESLEVYQLLQEARERFQQLRNSSLKTIARSLVSQDVNIFNRAYSPGLQEYIEALTLFHYLDKAILIDHAVVQESLTFTEPMEFNQHIDVPTDGLTLENATVSVPLTPQDFLLGIGDLTGELMRYSVTHASNPAMQDSVFKLCEFSQAILLHCQNIPFSACRDFGMNKLKVMFQSVIKIERICYQLALRREENLPALPAGFMELDYPEDTQHIEAY